MKLYTKPGACSTADHIALCWCGAKFESQNVTPELLKDPKFLELNPMGQIPVLVDGDFVLTQNVAILTYIAESFPNAKLLGDGSLQQKAEALRWLSFVNADVHPKFALIFGGTKYSSDPAVVEALSKGAREILHKLFGQANDQLNGKEWIAGFRSVADPYFFMTLTWAKRLNIDLSNYANLQNYFEKMQKDQGVQAAFKAEGLI
ncbi:Glutathione S-transferase (GstA) (PDB:1A0F) [Commensalibacter communis]|uniref:Glutathione S-transferase (GstA) n=1 Tax=Commensalibacter communis TaxID=2972786 RepID=A0A9W4TMS0_9PROT|nr:glutathione S-transferase N-terminal domain-containing protein [Commensalibacter communis]CAI3937079.1 Glutathione S-transferase (GstA) (PDB:1A0F) [Commensalibacter communis]CAI3943243.1 Glutathione S-transferase (GstA) (PDB:1A0F) [Commensalibacter communis]CAI3943431.1 Glutathione S-transferase (GstA) (PDB:1A0F) [Commensalibacter communis]CAI3946377.1 Glutathione S-transferase (GstA) (PDB:1A0F) [Commensalibacter communis]